MWPFTKKEIETERIRYIDWSKVKTTKDVVGVLRNTGLLHSVRVPEEHWTNPAISHLMTDEVYIRNLDDYSITTENQTTTNDKH